MFERSKRKLDYDVIIIGGGPGGSTVASMLARAGHRALVLEKSRFPRYQIGESLLLATWDIFRVLGLEKRISNAGFERKPGATFIWGNESRPWSVYFSELNGRQADSRNVKRAEFDAILLERSIELGAEVRFETSVDELLLDKGRVTGVSARVGGRRKKITARYVVDASGRSSPISKQLVRRYCPDDFKGAAIWTYFRKVKRLPEPNAGNILYAMFSWGWFWVIPMADDITSVGVVMNPPKFKQQVKRVGGREQLYKAAIESCPAVANMLAGAEQTDEMRSCADYSLNSDRYSGDGFLLVGDAACFIDPILSTGVHLAMRGGFLAGLALNTILKSDEESALVTFERLYRQEYERLLAVSRQQYELNQERSERFWNAHCLVDPNLKKRDFDADRHAFIELIAGMDSDRETVIAADRENRAMLFMKYGPGRFDAESFLGERLSIATGTLQFERGYRLGPVKRLTFAKGSLVISARGSRVPIRPADVELLSDCDGRRSVADVILRYRKRHGLAPIYQAHLQRSLGYWVDQAVLHRPNAAEAVETASVF